MSENTHDPGCPLAPYAERIAEGEWDAAAFIDDGGKVQYQGCDCALIARVRADERGRNDGQSVILASAVDAMIAEARLDERRLARERVEALNLGFDGTAASRASVRASWERYRAGERPPEGHDAAADAAGGG